jgi:hypothetical protein
LTFFLAAFSFFTLGAASVLGAPMPPKDGALNSTLGDFTLAFFSTAAVGAKLPGLLLPLKGEVTTRPRATAAPPKRPSALVRVPTSTSD